MPCRCDDYDYLSASERTSLHDKIDTLTQHLCWSMDIIERFMGPNSTAILRSAKTFSHLNAPHDLIKWWEDHKESDRKRLEREYAIARRANLKKSAMAKLTDAEKEALGIQ